SAMATQNGSRGAGAASGSGHPRPEPRGPALPAAHPRPGRGAATGSLGRFARTRPTPRRRLIAPATGGVDVASGTGGRMEPRRERNRPARRPGDAEKKEPRGGTTAGPGARTLRSMRRCASALVLLHDLVVRVHHLFPTRARGLLLGRRPGPFRRLRRARRSALRRLRLVDLLPGRGKGLHELVPGAVKLGQVVLLQRALRTLQRTIDPALRVRRHPVAPLAQILLHLVDQRVELVPRLHLLLPDPVLLGVPLRILHHPLDLL